jgi:hypothetical protein
MRWMLVDPCIQTHHLCSFVLLRGVAGMCQHVAFLHVCLVIGSGGMAYCPWVGSSQQCAVPCMVWYAWQTCGVSPCPLLAIRRGCSRCTYSSLRISPRGFFFVQCTRCHVPCARCCVPCMPYMFANAVVHSVLALCFCVSNGLLPLRSSPLSLPLCGVGLGPVS